jgi:ABC-type microcin C transport system duplicated ATPase subunit YejF
MIFQEPMTSLNPVLTIGVNRLPSRRDLHLKMDSGHGSGRTRKSMLDLVEIPAAPRAPISRSTRTSCRGACASES